MNTRRATRGGTKLLAVIVAAAALLVLMAAPALAAPEPPVAADFGLRTAHHATHGTPGHYKIPFTCPMPHDECMGMGM